MEAAMVKRAEMKEPDMSQMRFVGPILSPMRPRKEPAMKERREQRACWSGRWNDKSLWPEWDSNRRARASANWRVG